MATDIILDADGKERITFAAVSLKTTAPDTLIDSPARHKGKPGLRRAPVHNVEDGLTIYFNGDYPGGRTLLDARIRLRINRQIPLAPILPKRAEPGEGRAQDGFPPLDMGANPFWRYVRDHVRAGVA